MVPYWGAHNSHGEGSVGKDLKDFVRSAPRRASVIASRGSWLAFSFAKSVGDGAHEPRGTAPVCPLYVFGRTQDISLQKPRNNIGLPEPTMLNLEPRVEDIRRIGAEAVTDTGRASQAVEFANPKNPHCFPMAIL
jgi:hypothetical protein